PTPVAHPVVGLGKTDAGLLPVVRALPLAREVTVGGADFVQGSAEELGRGDFVAVTERQEGGEAEVHPHRARYRLVRFRIQRLVHHAQEQPEPPRPVPLDGYSFDSALNWARERELVDAVPDTDSVAAEVLPPRLLQCEGGVLAALL